MREMLQTWVSFCWWCWVQLLTPVQLFETLCITALQAALLFTLSQRVLKLMSIESVLLSNHLLLCHPLLLLLSAFTNNRV